MRDTGATIPRSVRLGRDLDRRLREAAERAHVSESELIRQAIAERSDAILSDTLERRLAGYVGRFRLGGGVARRTGEAFTELLVEEQRLRQRRGRRSR